jgi:predicted Mrr-cat superfamily restriction endonuclease
MNSVVIVVDMNVKKIIQKMVITYKDWHEMLLFAHYAIDYEQLSDETTKLH